MVDITNWPQQNPPPPFFLPLTNSKFLSTKMIQTKIWIMYRDKNMSKLNILVIFIFRYNYFENQWKRDTIEI